MWVDGLRRREPPRAGATSELILMNDRDATLERGCRYADDPLTVLGRLHRFSAPMLGGFSRFPFYALVVAMAAGSISSVGAQGGRSPGADVPQEIERAPEVQTRAAEELTEVEMADAQALYSAALALDEEGRSSSAITAYKRAIKKYPFAKQAGPAQFRVAELLEATGDSSRAFDAYQFLLQRYPDTPNFEQAVAAQVTIANKYLAGKPQKFFGVPIGNSAERAQEMYTAIVANAPYSKFAPVAQFNLGLSYEKQSLPFDAIKAYQTLIDSYPTSDVNDDALYQIGFVYMRVGFGSGSQDMSALVSAKNTFDDFLIEFPNSEKAPQARENLEQLDGKQSADIIRIAEFYEFSKDLKAAVIYYNDVIRRAPNTEDATLAKARIEELRAKYGDEALRTGPESAESGEKMALRRRLQAQVETSALADYSGPPTRLIVPDELPASAPRMRTSVDDVRPLPAVEPELPTE